MVVVHIHPARLCRLLFQELRAQGDLIGRDLPESQHFQDLFSILKCKYVIGAFITELFSCVRIDMAHHQADLFLRIKAQVNPFGNDAPYHLMVVLTAAFLVGSVGIAVEDPGAPVPLPVKFDGIYADISLWYARSPHF